LANSANSVSEEGKQAIKEVAATGYAAGADTTVSALGTFFYAMAMCPDVQKKAQQEIDRIIGSDRLVTYDDRDSLPYVEAVYREVLRWRPVAPLGVARSTLEEDVYNGYYIPKGATVLINIWCNLVTYLDT
jgi:cytochrome P450